MTPAGRIEAGDAPVPDAAPGNLVDRLAPASWRPYLRLARIDRPTGWWLLLLPCWWSTALAAGAGGSGFPSPATLALFWIGAVAMRGAGCTYNDIVDRDLDRQVERTRGRPIPAGQVTPRQAALFMAAQALVGLAVLLTFNRFAIGLGFASLAVVAAYPFMKRVTSWPQAVLGLAFSWGALMGWAAAFGALAWPAVALYAGAVFWTMGYDTIYAVQDFEDDGVAGIRSTARLFGAHTRLAVGILYGLAALGVAAALWGAGVGPAGLAGLAGFVAHLGWQLRTVRVDDPRGALRLFRANRDAGLLLFAGLAVDAALRAA
ncbi:4-hydroxybenzoate octaprenyltransferase [Alsobacter sp. SYSU M60028]|uniref:4-hydroxybenzoate octaprenyltransferase n=1 Tax=Alsobacter ponti TaxID=2962936 RepID=A0ABT1LCL6_9HYPH|nr:4-hydroxybenzoate octaprenyltransferase [Alsobacter ponti]